MIKAIVIDDEVAVSSIIKHFFEKEQLPIELVGIAENGQSGLKLIEKYNPKIVFIDIQMPILNGFEVISQKPDFDYIIITAYDSFDYAQKALRVGAKDILVKPIDFRQLRETIQRVIGWQFTNNILVNTILEYLNENYMKNITLNDIALHLHSSVSHISKIFKNEMSISIISYLHQIRIKKAIELLTESSLSIKEIASEVGYDNLNNFYMHFKKITNLTPASYLRKIE